MAPRHALLLALAPLALAHQPSSYSSCPYPAQTGPNYDYTSFPCDQAVRASAVVEQFRYAWDGYYRHAFPHDELQPLNNTFRDGRNGWGATAFDALSTAVIMEQADIVDQILEFVPHVDFTRVGTPVEDSVSLFETNIRYIGGMLSGYDLLKGPFSYLHIANRSAVDVLVQQAKCLADTLKFAFDTPTGIPVNWVIISNHTFANNNQQADGLQTAGLAELGTLVLEWQRLSDLTGDPSYGQLARRAESYWLHPQPASAVVWPGLTGGNFSVQTGEIQNRAGGWQSSYDSAYEYLLKAYVYDPVRYADFGDYYELAANSTIQHLKSKPARRPDLTYIAEYDGEQLTNETDSLACFAGGSFMLGSTVRKRPEWKQFGLELAEFCANGYRETPVGIGPLHYSWNETDFAASAVSQNQSEFYTKAGFWIDPSNFNPTGEAPEAVESWYYAYQLTGDQYWRDVAWAYTVAQNETLRKGSGFASLVNPFDAEAGNVNLQQTFMLAEVLKYQYLIQWTVQGEWNVFGAADKKNQFVFNTEAHPLRVAAQQLV